MLVLTRKEGQSILIGDSIVVRIIGADRGSARIGIEAPDDVKILREELAEKEPGKGRR